MLNGLKYYNSPLLSVNKKTIIYIDYRCWAIYKAFTLSRGIRYSNLIQRMVSKELLLLSLYQKK